MSTVYIVTDGDYSDYRICGVFTDKKLADSFCEYHNFDQVEEHGANPDVPTYTHVLFCCSECDGNLWVDRTDTRYTYTDEVKLNDHSYATSLSLSGYVLAKDQAHAEKIWQDRVRAILAGSTFVVRTYYVRSQEPDGRWVQKQMQDTCRYDGESYTVLTTEERK